MASPVSDKPVDWSQPLEAVHEDGRRFDVAGVRPSGGIRSDYLIDSDVPFSDCPYGFKADGRAFAPGYGWTIRNRQPATQDIPSEVVERMVGLVRGVAEWNPEGYAVQQLSGGASRATEARAIVALLPKPIDLDLVEAREIVAATYESGDNMDAEHRGAWAKHCRAGAYDTDRNVRNALAGIKRGRDLGSAGK